MFLKHVIFHSYDLAMLNNQRGNFPYNHPFSLLNIFENGDYSYVKSPGKTNRTRIYMRNLHHNFTSFMWGFP